MIHRIMKQCTTVPDQCYAKSCSDPSKIAVFSFSCLFLAFKISTLTSFIFSVTSVSSYLVLYWQCFPLAHIAEFGCVSLVTIMRVFFRPEGSKIVQLLIFCLFCFVFLLTLVTGQRTYATYAHLLFMYLHHQDYSSRAVEHFKTLQLM